MIDRPLMKKALRYIRSARILADDEDYDSAISRIYYAMFYIAECALETEGLSFSSHKSVISAFGQYFAKSGLIDPHYHHVLLSAFSQRQISDYVVETDIQKQDIEQLLQEAEGFFNAVDTYLDQTR